MAMDYERPAPVAAEVVLRLLHEMDEDLDEFITEADIVRYVKKHNMPFPEALVAAMFAEANSSANGLMDADELGKAVSFKFAYRRHNDHWAQLFELAPRPDAAARLTALASTPIEQEPIRAVFEQEPSILTFNPITNPPGAGTIPLGTACTSSFASVSTRRSSPLLGSTGAPFNTAPRPLFEGAQLGPEAERKHEADLNRRMLPDAHLSAPQPAAAPLRPGAEVASFHGEGPPLRCTFDAQAAFARSVEHFERTKAGAGWETRKPPAYFEALAAAERADAPLHYGLHRDDYFYTPGGSADWIPLRVDGAVTRVSGQGPAPSLRLLVSEGSQHGLANSRLHRSREGLADAEPASGDAQTHSAARAPPKDAKAIGAHAFRSRFARSRNLDLRKGAAQDRLAAAKGVEYPAGRCYFKGKPDPHEFRAFPDGPNPEMVPPGAPPFVTATLGRAWPRILQVGEGVGPSLIAQANPPNAQNPPLRLAMTENTPPAARSTRAAMVSDVVGGR